MLPWLLLAFLLSPTGSTTVLVRQPPSVNTEHATSSVLGWRRAPAGRVEPGDQWVPDARLDLLGPDPSTEPLSDEEWALDTLRVKRAWRETTGNPGVVIALVDSGIEMSHPDLRDRLYTNPGEIAGNGIDDDGNGLVDDIHGWDIVDDDNDPGDPTVGHGTEVAGVALASLNGIGVVGIAPTATLLPIRACTNSCGLFDVAWGIVYAVDSGADIINLSLGGFAQPGPLSDALDYAQSKGVLVVAAAGNTATDVDGQQFVPASLPNPNMVTVAATDRTDRLWDGSNTGKTTIDVGAPGVEIATTTLSSLGSFGSVTGTSFSAAQVSGTAALMLSVNPALAPEELIQRLGTHGAPLPDLVSNTVYGTRIQADLAVMAARFEDSHISIFDRDIVWLAAEGITKGCNPPANTMFCPQLDVSRAQMAAFLTRAFDYTVDQPNAFLDDDLSIFESDIDALASAGVTKGCNPPTNDRFCPNSNVTRGEMAAFLVRALGLPPGPDAFTDDDGSQFEPAIDALAGAGITKGCNPPLNDRFCPGSPLTRGEMAALLHRALG